MRSIRTGSLGGGGKVRGGGRAGAPAQGHWVLTASGEWPLNTEPHFLLGWGLSRLKMESNEVTKARDVCKLLRPDLEKMFLNRPKQNKM